MWDGHVEKKNIFFSTGKKIYFFRCKQKNNIFAENIFLCDTEYTVTHFGGFGGGPKSAKMGGFSPI